MDGNPEEVLTKKLGPLPGYVWVLIAAGGGFLYYRYKKGAAVPVAVTPVADASGVMPVAVGDAPGTNTSGGYTAAGAQGVSTPTNASWASMVADALIGSGGDPTATSNALSNYLNGNTLDPQQQSIVNTALRQYGAPPNGVLPVQTGPAFVGHVYTIQQGDTLAGVLKKFYGTVTPVTQRIVGDNNPGLSSSFSTAGTPLPVGSKIKLPTVGIGGVQPNTLNTYDGSLPSWVNPADIPGGYTIAPVGGN